MVSSKVWEISNKFKVINVKLISHRCILRIFFYDLLKMHSSNIYESSTKSQSDLKSRSGYELFGRVTLEHVKFELSTPQHIYLFPSRRTEAAWKAYGRFTQLY